jgi:hypothetical protein
MVKIKYREISIWPAFGDESRQCVALVTVTHAGVGVSARPQVR